MPTFTVQALRARANQEGMYIHSRSEHHVQICDRFENPLVDVWPTKAKFLRVRANPGEKATVGNYEALFELAREMDKHPKPKVNLPCPPEAAEALADYMNDDDNIGFPWCEACGSYHHPDNPTCVRQDKQSAPPAVRGQRPGNNVRQGKVTDPLREQLQILRIAAERLLHHGGQLDKAIACEIQNFISAHYSA